MTCAKKLEVSVATPALFCLFLDKFGRYKIENGAEVAKTL